MKKIAILLVTLCFSLSLTSCLKTRSQLKEENEIAIENQKMANKESEVDNLKNEIAKLNGKIEEIEHSSKGNKTENQQLNAKIQELEATILQKNEEIKRLNEEAAQKCKVEEKEPSTDKVTGDEYALGLREFKNKKYEEALKSFRAYTKANPKGKYTPDAFFMAGETQKKLSKKDLAILEYSKVFTKFPKSKLAPTALMRTIECFDDLGQKSEADSFRDLLEKNYPDSKAPKKINKSENIKVKNKKGN